MSQKKPEQNYDVIVDIYAAAIRELDDAQRDYMKTPSEDGFKRFWLARERYQALTVQIGRDMLVNDAMNTYGSSSP